MLDDKPDKEKSDLELLRVCPFWLTRSHANGYCRIVSKEGVDYYCHYSNQGCSARCNIFKAFMEGREFTLKGEEDEK